MQRLMMGMLAISISGCACLHDPCPSYITRDFMVDTPSITGQVGLKQLSDVGISAKDISWKYPPASDEVRMWDSQQVAVCRAIENMPQGPERDARRREYPNILIAILRAYTSPTPISSKTSTTAGASPATSPPASAAAETHVPASTPATMSAPAVDHAAAFPLAAATEAPSASATPLASGYYGFVNAHNIDRETELVDKCGHFKRITATGDFNSLCSAASMTCDYVCDFEGQKKPCNENPTDGSRVAWCHK